LAQNNFRLRSALFWDITQRKVVIRYRLIGTTCRSQRQGSWPFRFLAPEDGTDRLHRNICKELPLFAA